VGEHRQLKKQAGSLLAELGRDPDEVAVGPCTVLLDMASPPGGRPGTAPDPLPSA
jgi:hypothetical protein